MPKISIIVPVYKVEKYLNRCVDSILNQSIHDIEIILVDDGSPDSCPKMCDDLALKDNRIRVVHKQNGGLSSARNAGIAVAVGEYIGFVDSDDTIVSDMYEKMLQTIENERVDFVMSDYIRIPAKAEPYLKTLDIRGGYYGKDALKHDIYPQLIMGENIDYGPLVAVWHCLYRYDFLHKNNIRFDEDVRWSEDNIFSAIVGYCASSFFYMKGEGLYNYYQNQGTISTSYRPGAWQVYCTMNAHLHEFFDKVNDYNFNRQLKLHIIYYACNCIGQSILLPKDQSISEIKRILRSKELTMAFKNFAIPYTSWKMFIMINLMKFRLARLIYTIRSKKGGSCHA